MKPAWTQTIGTETEKETTQALAFKKCKGRSYQRQNKEITFVCFTCGRGWHLFWIVRECLAAFSLWIEGGCISKRHQKGVSVCALLSGRQGEQRKKSTRALGNGTIAHCQLAQSSPSHYQMGSDARTHTRVEHLARVMQEVNLAPSMQFTQQSHTRTKTSLPQSGQA